MKKFILFLALICVFSNSFSQKKLLVRFGANAGQNVYNTTDFPGWNNVAISDSTKYTTIDGISGTTLSYSGTEHTNFQSISGPSRQFAYGQRIYITWYNGTGVQTSFRPLVSFTATGKPMNVDGQPFWYITREDVWVETMDSVVTYYDITNVVNAGTYMPPSEGNKSIVNVSVNSTFTDVICMKIEIGQADTTPPSVPQNVQITNISYNSIGLKWNHCNDNQGGDGINKYKIYVDSLYHGYTEDTAYTCYYISPAQNHTFQVSAVDSNNNESVKSFSLNQTTQSYANDPVLINPVTDFKYLGAFKLPSSFDWMNGDPAYYPNGDPSNTDSFPGSLFMPGIPYQNVVAEISIPSPVKSKDTSLLPFTSFLQNFADIRSPNVNDGGGNFAKGAALEWLPQQSGQSHDYLYTCFGDYYQVGGERLNSFGASNTNLLNPQPVGGWYIGDSANYTEPHYMSTITFNFEIPFSLNNHKLITGGNRYGDWHKGPTLVAYSPWNDQAPLPSNLTELNHTNLLMYDNLSGNNHLNGDADLDLWTGGAWITKGNKSAVIIAGLKGFGESWYGYYNGESVESLYCIPTPVELEDHGPRQSRFKSVFLLYKPNDIIAVGNGNMQPYEPQPYAYLDIQDAFIHPNNDDSYYDWSGAGGMAYDRTNGYIYLVERNANPNLNITTPGVVHVWEIKDSILSVNQNNYLNNIDIYSSENSIFIKSDESISGKLNIYNMLGKSVYNEILYRNYYKKINIFLEKGIYLISISTEKEVYTKKIFIE